MKAEISEIISTNIGGARDTRYNIIVCLRSLNDLYRFVPEIGLGSVRHCKAEWGGTVREIEVPKELLWDYDEAPHDPLWRLQRIVDFFPAYGTDEEIVRLLFEHRDKLNMEEGKYRLIALYHEVWNAKTNKGN